MIDIVCVGTTTIDLYYKGTSLQHDDTHFHLTVGGKYFTDFFYEGVGGGATNVAIGCAKLGLRSSLIAEIGDNPFKRVIFEKLDLAGVSRTHCPITNDYYNCSTVLLTEEGEKTVINYRTQKSTLLHLLPEEKLLERSKALYLGGTAHIAEKYRVRLLRYAKSLGLTTFVTLSSEDCQKEHRYIDEIIAQTDVLLLNVYECALLLGKEVKDVNWARPLHSRMGTLTLPPLVVVTDGVSGSYAYKGERVYRHEAIPVRKVVDATGAGDGYAAGFIVGFLKTKGEDISSAMKLASHYASVKLHHLGAN